MGFEGWKGVHGSRQGASTSGQRGVTGWGICRGAAFGHWGLKALKCSHVNTIQNGAGRGRKAAQENAVWANVQRGPMDREGKRLMDGVGAARGAQHAQWGGATGHGRHLLYDSPVCPSWPLLGPLHVVLVGQSRFGARRHTCRCEASRRRGRRCTWAGQTGAEGRMGEGSAGQAQVLLYGASRHNDNSVTYTCSVLHVRCWADKAGSLPLHRCHR